MMRWWGQREEAARELPRITPQEWYSLSPWRKFKLKGMLPLTIICHILLVGLVTVEICVRNSIWAPYAVGSSANLSQISSAA